MVLKALGGDVRITMYRQKPRIACKSRDGGVFRRGQIGGENEVEQGPRTLPWGTPDLTSWQSEHASLYLTWK